MAQSLGDAHLLSLTFFFHHQAAESVIFPAHSPVPRSIFIGCRISQTNHSSDFYSFAALCQLLDHSLKNALRKFLIIPCPEPLHVALGPTQPHTHTHTPSTPLLSIWLLARSAAEFTAGPSQARSSHMFFVFLSQFLEFTHFRALKAISARVIRQDWQCPCSEGKHCRANQPSSPPRKHMPCKSHRFFGLLQAGPPTSS